LLLATMLFASNSSAEFFLGYNQAWFKEAYGSSLLPGSFDAREVDRNFALARAWGATVVRLWLFEGSNPQGVLWDGEPGPRPKPPPADRTRSRPTGLSPEVLANLRQVLAAAERHRVLLYLTLFDGNYPRIAGKDFETKSPSEKSRERLRFAEHWNILNDKYQAGTYFRRNVLCPLLREIAPHWRAIFAVDLVNEINARVQSETNAFEGGWKGAKTFIRSWTAYLKRLWPGLHVTTSLGNSCALQDLLPSGKGPRNSWCPSGGRQLSGLGLDFYDFHLYSDIGEVPYCGALSSLRKADRVPMVLGEFGQSSKAFDSDLQVKVTRAFVENAKRCGLWGALAWRLSDVRRPTPAQPFNPEARLSYEAYGRPRPAAETMRELATDADPAPPSAAPPGWLPSLADCP
jgi:endo-1,4-beta-mannosidase